MPAIGGLLGVPKVSARGRQSLRGDFAVLSLALKFAFPGNRRLGLQSVGSRFLLTARKAKHPVLYNSAQAAQLLTCHQSSLAHQAPSAAELIEGAISGRWPCFSQNLLKDVTKAILILRVEQPLTNHGNCFGKEVLILPRTPTDEKVDFGERKLLRRALVGRCPTSCASKCEKGKASKS